MTGKTFFPYIALQQLHHYPPPKRPFIIKGRSFGQQRQAGPTHVTHCGKSFKSATATHFLGAEKLFMSAKVCEIYCAHEVEWSESPLLSLTHARKVGVSGEFLWLLWSYGRQRRSYYTPKVASKGEKKPPYLWRRESGPKTCSPSTHFLCTG